MAAPRRYYSPNYRFTSSLSSSLKKMQNVEDTEMRFKWDTNQIGNDEYLSYTQKRLKQADTTTDQIKWQRNIIGVQKEVRADKRMMGMYEISKLQGKNPEETKMKADLMFSLAEDAYNDGDNNAYISAMTQANNLIDQYNRSAQAAAEAAAKKAYANNKKLLNNDITVLKNNLKRAKIDIDNSGSVENAQDALETYGQIKNQLIGLLGEKANYIEETEDTAADSVRAEILSQQEDELYKAIPMAVSMPKNFSFVQTNNAMGIPEIKIMATSQIGPDYFRTASGMFRQTKDEMTPVLDTAGNITRMEKTGRRVGSATIQQSLLNEQDQFKEWAAKRNIGISDLRLDVKDRLFQTFKKDQDIFNRGITGLQNLTPEEQVRFMDQNLSKDFVKYISEPKKNWIGQDTKTFTELTPEFSKDRLTTAQDYAKQQLEQKRISTNPLLLMKEYASYANSVTNPFANKNKKKEVLSTVKYSGGPLKALVGGAKAIGTPLIKTIDTRITQPMQKIMAPINNPIAKIARNSIIPIFDKKAGFLKDLINKNLSWGETAKQFESKYGKIATGSQYDRMLWDKYKPGQWK